MLLGIFSYSKGGDRRNLIRETYLSTGDERFCSLDDFIEQQSKYDGPKLIPCQVIYTFVIGGGGKDRPTDHDDSKPLTVSTDDNGNSEKDCTYLNIKENMEHGKSTTYMKFASSLAEEYDIDFIGKFDDDSLLGPNVFIDFMDENLPPAPYNRRIYGGSVRTSRTKNHFYAAGEFYFMSTDLAHWVGHEMGIDARNKVMIYIEDLDMGSYIHSHPRPIKYINLFLGSPYFHPLKKESEFREHWDLHMDRLSLELPKNGMKIPWICYCKPILNGNSL